MLYVALIGVLGLLIGSFLNVVIWRVPRDESLIAPSHCPECEAVIKPWQNVPILSWVFLRGRCSNCSVPISARYPIVELVTGAAFALVAWWWLSATPLAGMIAAFFRLQSVDLEWGANWLLNLGGLKVALVALLWFAAITIALTVIDIEHQRLPDRIVLPSLVVILVLLAGATVLMALSGDASRTFEAWGWTQLIQTFGGAAALFALYFLIALIYPAGMGGGDVKLAPIIGAMLGFFGGWGALIVGAFAGFLLGGLWGIALMIAKRAGRKSAIPFGPFMLAGAWIGIFAGEPIAHWYLRVVGLA